MASITNQTYTPVEEAEIQQWLTTSERLTSSGENLSILETLNNHLASRTTLLGSKPSKADIAIYQSLAPTVAKWSADQRTGEKGHPHIVRHLDFVQHSAMFGLNLSNEQKFVVDQDDIRYVKPPVDVKAEKERLKKEKAAAATVASGGSETKETSLVDRTKDKVKETVDEVKDAAAAVTGGGKAKQKKEKAPKQQKAPAATPAAAATQSPCLIDLRVGHILKAVNHPDADSLYVSTIAMGDAAGNEDYVEYEGQVCRTVCSGLNGHIPLEEMQGRKVIVVCNLKPVKMRGVKSCAMVLAASPKVKEGEIDHDKGPVELVAPPEGSKAGDRVFFEGWRGEPEGVLNPKKKIWETYQPGFTTTDSLEVVFDASVVEKLGKTDVGKLVTENGGVCTVQTLKGAAVR